MKRQLMYDDITQLLKQEEFLYMNSDGFIIYTPKDYVQMMMKEGQLTQVNIHTVEESIILKEDKHDEAFGVSNIAS